MRVKGINKLPALCSALGLDKEIWRDRLRNGMSGKNKLNIEIRNRAIRYLDDHYDDRLLENIKAHSEESYNRLVYTSLPPQNAFATWSDAIASQERFSKLRTGSINGSYFIIRRENSDYIISCWMHIRSPDLASPLSSFSTFRPATKGRERVVRGVIFEAGEKIFSFGRAKHGHGFRSTIMTPITRSTDRHDMLGVRLGMHEDPSLPFAYPIYCYQLKRFRSRSEIMRSVGRFQPSEFAERSRINGFSQIMSYLDLSAGSSDGVSIRRALGDEIS